MRGSTSLGQRRIAEGEHDSPVNIIEFAPEVDRFHLSARGVLKNVLDCQLYAIAQAAIREHWLKIFIAKFLNS